VTRHWPAFLSKNSSSSSDRWIMQNENVQNEKETWAPGYVELRRSLSRDSGKHIDLFFLRAGRSPADGQRYTPRYTLLHHWSMRCVPRQLFHPAIS